MREMIRGAVRFWEPLRALYNGALVAMVLARFLTQLPESRRALEADVFIGLFVMTVVANVLYCSAYAIDIPLQHAFGEGAGRWRWPTFAIGTLFALALAYFVTAGMFMPDALD